MWYTERQTSGYNPLKDFGAFPILKLECTPRNILIENKQSNLLESRLKLTSTSVYLYTLSQDGDWRRDYLGYLFRNCFLM